MIVFRIGKSVHSRDLSGKGAELAGGRWNSKGVAVLYTCSSVALALTEVAVHLPLGITPKNYSLTEIEIPDRLSIFDLPKKDYPDGWMENPPSFSTKILGDKFIRDGKFAIMKVTSAVVPFNNNCNYLINSNHSDADKIKILNVISFPFDKRLFER
jgi:RES domain-containing protein